MSRPCSICNHEQRHNIDIALVNGASMNEVSRNFAVGEDALLRHRNGHIPLALREARASEVARDADRLLRDVRSLWSKSMQLMARAEEADDLRTALLGVREARGSLELCAKLIGQLDERPVEFNFMLTPMLWALQELLVDVAEAAPQVKPMIMARLGDLEELARDEARFAAEYGPQASLRRG